MARVTVEDCILKVPNRFELVLLSSQRAREIGSGAALGTGMAYSSQTGHIIRLFRLIRGCIGCKTPSSSTG